MDAALTALLGKGHHTLLTADAGPQKRYRQWLAVHRGSVRAVVGTRAAMFAPVRDLGLVALWDDGNENHSEQHAPQPHAREVLMLRAAHENSAVLLGSVSCTVEAAQLVDSGWAVPVAADRAVTRAAAPRVRTIADHDLAATRPPVRPGSLPRLAGPARRTARGTGPRPGAPARLRTPAGLRAVPRTGPLPAVRRPPPGGRVLPAALRLVRAPGGRLALRGVRRVPAARQVTGARRTAEELGRAFPSVPVRTSGREQVLDTVDAAPALVVSTPGAEPVAEGGYAAAVLLDGWALLNRPDLRGRDGPVALGCLPPLWSAASRRRHRGDRRRADTRPRTGPGPLDPVGYALREYADRSELGFPPVSRMAAVAGPQAAVAEFLGAVDLPPDAEILGPVRCTRPPNGGVGARGRGRRCGRWCECRRAAGWHWRMR